MRISDWSSDVCSSDLAWAASIAKQPTTRRHEVEAWTDLLDAADWTPPVFPLKGRDLLTLGLKPGPAVGRLLEEIERWWVDNDRSEERREGKECVRTGRVRWSACH